MPVILVLHYRFVRSVHQNVRCVDDAFFGLLGFAERMKIPLAPFVIGFILAPIAEENLQMGLMASNGSFLRSCNDRSP